MKHIAAELVIAEILSDYGNTAYLRKAKTSSFEKVEGTKLWHLWYGESLTDFCVRTLEDEYKKAKRNAELIPAFEANLKNLLNSLKEEFNKLEIADREEV